jgi:hypothetical protein
MGTIPAKSLTEKGESELVSEGYRIMLGSSSERVCHVPDPNGEGVTEIFFPDQARAIIWPHEINVDAESTPCSSFFGTINVDQLPQLSSPRLLVECFDVKSNIGRVWSWCDGERMSRRIDESET